MRLSVSVPRLILALVLVAPMIGAPAHAQKSGGVHVKVNVPDSIAHVVDRETLAKAHFAIVSRDGTAALLLMDTTIIAEMTDTGLARMNSREATDTIKGAVNRLFAGWPSALYSRCSTTVSRITCGTSPKPATPTDGYS